MAGTAHVDHGPRWYRVRLRALGPLAAVAPPLLWGAGAWVVLATTSHPVLAALGLFGVLTAAPILLVAGAPLGSAGLYPLAVAGSVAMWASLGVWAARRATRRSVAGWPEFWEQYLWMVAGVVLGTLGALGAVVALYGSGIW